MCQPRGHRYAWIKEGRGMKILAPHVWSRILQHGHQPELATKTESQAPAESGNMF